MTENDLTGLERSLSMVSHSGVGIFDINYWLSIGYISIGRGIVIQTYRQEDHSK